MKFRRIIFCFTIFSLMLNHAFVQKVMAEQYEPALSAIVLFGMPLVKEIKQYKNFKKDECLQKYLKAIPAKSFLLTAASLSGPDNTFKYRQRNLEEQIVVILGDKSKEEAKAFSKAVPLCIEWEGMSEGPLNEANFVDNWLSNRPGTPIAPFLYLFKAHRLRAAFEAAKFGNEKGLWPILAKRYKESLEKALSFGNPLISCIAKDMEEQPYVYLEGHGKP
ncbi:MAG: hypothetical protein KBG22_07535 [Smithella sp.]|nr:hypothetical protein [Smithella sp.]HQI73940.1 hypothetical protein [Smithella sp.]